MTLTTFDTHKFVRRLERAGMPLEQAEAQADVLTEAFTVNLESLVTKDYLESRLDARFAEQKAYMDTRFAELEARLTGKIDSNHRIFLFTQAIIIVAVVLPQIQRFIAL